MLRVVFPGGMDIGFYRTMLNSFIKVVFRYLMRSRFFAILNVAGLSIGMGCCIVIYLFISDELSYDRFHSHGDHIYRVLRQSHIHGMPYDIGVTSGPYAPALIQDYGDKIQAFTRAMSTDGLLVKYEDKSFLEDQMLLADPNFFEFFSYPLSKGDPKNVLENPNSIVVSKAFAKKYFGDVDPIGKIVNIDLENEMVVTGILDDLPGNTHLQFQTVSSIKLLESEEHFREWWNNYLFTYVRVDNPSDVAYLNHQFVSFMDKYMGSDFQRIGNRIGLKLEPLKDIYFNYGTRYERNVVHGNRLYVYVFGSLGGILILLAAINYINLATAQSVKRSKEVGVRKTLGSSQTGIALQFLSESFTLCFVAMILAVMLSQVAIPLINDFAGLSIPPVLSHSTVWLFLGALVLVICVLSGSYPAFLLSSLKPIRVLKGEVKGNLEYLLVRKALVVFQFTMSAVMIIGTLFIGKQLRFLNEKDLGFTSDHVVQITINNPMVGDKIQSVKDRLLADKNIVNVAVVSGHPGGFYDASTVEVEGQHDNLRMRTLWSDENLVATLGIKMLAGRYFAKDMLSDRAGSVVLNETAVKQLGWKPEAALGKRVKLAQFDSVYKEVIGVVQDYHFASLKQVIEPLIISNNESSRNLLVKIAPHNVTAGLSAIESTWNSYESGFPIEMVFLDEVMGRLYAGEANQGKLFTAFSFIAVLIACFGILGLSTYLAVQRKKEIGIRKVLGASTTQVSFLLTKDLLFLVLLANAVAIPVAYWAMDKWLENFAYRAPFDPFVFIIGGVSIVALAVIIVSLNAMRVAQEDPVKALRPE